MRLTAVGLFLFGVYRVIDAWLRDRSDVTNPLPAKSNFTDNIASGTPIAMHTIVTATAMAALLSSPRRKSASRKIALT